MLHCDGRPLNSTSGCPVFGRFYADRHSSKFSSVNLNAVMFGAATALVLGLVG